MSTVRREVALVRCVGDAPPLRHRWACYITPGPTGLDIRIGMSGDLGGPDLDAAVARLHRALLRQVPGVLRGRTRTEVGVVRTTTDENTSRSEYALVTCADVVLTLTDHVRPPVPVAPWSGTCPVTDLAADLPLVLGPSAVLSLVAGALELTQESAADLPGVLTTHALDVSPYPPHSSPETLGPAESGEAIAWWTTHVEHWMRPMRTTRSSRDRYSVRAELPTVPDLAHAVHVESLVSLDTSARCWQASLSVVDGGTRRWLTGPMRVEISADTLLRAAVARLGPARPALDHDPVDGESFGLAPTLLTDLEAGSIGIGRPAQEPRSERLRR